MNPRRLLVLVCTVAVVALVACTTVPRGAVDESRFKAPIRVACVGDSITYGFGIKDRATQSYPAQLAALLGAKWEVRNFGKSGATLLTLGDRPYVKQIELTKALEFRPDVVVIKLGTNDTKPQNWDKHGGEFTADFGALLDRFAALDPKPVIYLCRPVPVFGADVYGIRSDVLEKEILPRVDALAKERHLAVIDLHAALAGHAEMVPDKIHPNAAGATLMARAVYQALKGQPAPVTVVPAAAAK